MSSFLTVSLPREGASTDLINILTEGKMKFLISAKTDDHMKFMAHQKKISTDPNTRSSISGPRRLWPRTVPPKTPGVRYVALPKTSLHTPSASSGEPPLNPGAPSTSYSHLNVSHEVPLDIFEAHGVVKTEEDENNGQLNYLPYSAVPGFHGATQVVIKVGTRSILKDRDEMDVEKKTLSETTEDVSNCIQKASTSCASTSASYRHVQTILNGNKIPEMLPSVSENECVVKKEEGEVVDEHDTLLPVADSHYHDAVHGVKTAGIKASLKDCNYMEVVKTTQRETSPSSSDSTEKRPLFATDLFRRDEEEMELRKEAEISEKPPVIKDEEMDVDAVNDLDEEEEFDSDFDGEVDEAERFIEHEVDDSGLWTDSIATSSQIKSQVAICSECNLPESSIEHLTGLCGRSTIFECEYCYTKCASFHALQCHQRIHNKEKKKREKLNEGVVFECEICKGRFKNKKCLRNHQKTHDDARPFQCHMCTLAFRRKANLQKHLRVHSKVRKPFVCTKCDQKFTVETSLRSHMLLHTGERPYECDECGRKYRQQFALNYHKRVHSGERPFKCTMCDKAFLRSTTLQYHIARHEGERPFACKECPKKFVRSWDLTEHCKRRHSEKTTPSG